MRHRFPPGSRVLHAVVLLGPLVALLAGVPQGLGPPVWLVVVVAVFSLAHAVMPEHYVGGITLAIVVTFWVIEAGSALPVSSLLAAAALLAAHVAGTVAGYGPRHLPPDRAAVLLWIRRGIAAWLVAPVTWMVVDAEQDRATSASYWVLGLVVALALLVVAAALYPTDGDRRA
jgi:hypothetical protein